MLLRGSLMVACTSRKWSAKFGSSNPGKPGMTSRLVHPTVMSAARWSIEPDALYVRTALNCLSYSILNSALVVSVGRTTVEILIGENGLGGTMCSYKPLKLDWYCGSYCAASEFV